MKKLILLLFSFSLISLITQTFLTSITHAQTPTSLERGREAALRSPKQEFYKAKVISILEEGKKPVGNGENLFQKVELRILERPEKDKTVTVEHGGMFTITEKQKLRSDDTVILSKTVSEGKTTYRIADIYRLENLLYILAGFFLLVVITAGRKGFGSFLGMLISLAVIVFYIVPQILNGANPLMVSLIGSLFIMVSTIYLAHGFSRQTTIAICSTIISLVLTILLSVMFVNLSKLSGLGSEDIYSLIQGFAGKINFQGLLLGGIIIGTLGVLDDVTTTQTATIFALAEANRKYTIKDLITQGMKVGREHIASLVNTLVLAYAGASIGVFIFLILALRQQSQPLWVILNSELIVEEIIRTIAGSASLVLAVPITTVMASFFARYSLKIK